MSEPDRKSEWKREISAGGVVYKKKDGEFKVLLILPSGQRGKKGGKERWTWPKGWIADGESLEEAALRETMEEGGVHAAIRADLGGVKLFFKWEGENIFKTVQYYLMEYKDDTQEGPDFEVERTEWFTLEEARNKLIYKSDRDMLARAEKALQGMDQKLL